MATDTVLSIRTNSVIKNKAKKVLAGYGLDLSTAVNMYLKDIISMHANPSSGARLNHIYKNKKLLTLRDNS